MKEAMISHIERVQLLIIEFKHNIEPHDITVSCYDLKAG